MHPILPVNGYYLCVAMRTPQALSSNAATARTPGDQESIDTCITFCNVGDIYDVHIACGVFAYKTNVHVGEKYVLDKNLESFTANFSEWVLCLHFFQQEFAQVYQQLLQVPRLVLWKPFQTAKLNAQHTLYLD